MTNILTGVFPDDMLISKTKILNKLLNFKVSFVKAGIFVSLVAYWSIILVGTFITFN